MRLCHVTLRVTSALRLPPTRVSRGASSSAMITSVEHSGTIHPAVSSPLALPEGGPTRQWTAEPGAQGSRAPMINRLSGHTSAVASARSQPSASVPAAFRKAHQAAWGALARSAASAVMTMTTRTSGVFSRLYASTAGASRTASFAFCSSESGGAEPANSRMYSSRRCFYLSSRRRSVSVISRSAIASACQGRPRRGGLGDEQVSGRGHRLRPLRVRDWVSSRSVISWSRRQAWPHPVRSMSALARSASAGVAKSITVTVPQRATLA